MNISAPNLTTVSTIAHRYFNPIYSVERVPQGVSTYVYRISTNQGIKYIRFLPEGTSFAVEALAHNIMLNHGISVPFVIAVEDKNPDTELSLMITEEIPGQSILNECPKENIHKIIHEAGVQLAKLHQIPVDGFGWIDRCSYHHLRAEHQTFYEYLNQYMDEDLLALEKYNFTKQQRNAYGQWMSEALLQLDIPQASLVHGDFDISHIFHINGVFTGFIDFGEIRGCNPLFDLGTLLWADDTPERIFYHYLCEGYNQVTPLSKQDHYNISLIALYQLLRFLNRKKDTSAKDFWYKQALRQFDWMEKLK